MHPPIEALTRRGAFDVRRGVDQYADQMPQAHVLLVNSGGQSVRPALITHIRDG